jgi:adenine phosphoribosyltransferase
VSDPAALARLIRDVPDFPTPGVVFKDITPLLADGAAFAAAIDGLAELVAEAGIAVDRVVGIEARGFVVGAPLAMRLGVGFAPVRKPGKLPWATDGESYDLEYGTDRLELHTDAVGPGDRVLIVDDVIATGGTAAATARLVERQGAEVAAFAFLIELAFLGGRAQIADHRILRLLTY